MRLEDEYLLPSFGEECPEGESTDAAADYDGIQIIRHLILAEWVALLLHPRG